MSLPTLYTPLEVAEQCKVTRRAVYEWIKAGRLKAYKIGDAVRIPEEELLAFLKPVATKRQASPGRRAGGRRPRRRGA